MTGLDWSYVLAALALLVTALAHAVPRVVPVLRDAARGWRSRTHAEEVTAETVRGIVDAMRSALEDRIAGLETAHKGCTEKLERLELENGKLRDRVAELEAALHALNEEREELHAAIAGDRPVPRLLPPPPALPRIEVIEQRARKDG